MHVMKMEQMFGVFRQTHLEIEIGLGKVLVQRRGKKLRCHNDDAAENKASMSLSALQKSKGSYQK